jgi:hypothetical protein
MVGHIPLEDGIGVRVPDRQQPNGSKLLCFRQGRENLFHMSVLANGKGVLVM